MFDDFDAGMRYLTEFRYTSADRLAIMGGSNGGLTMGAALTQHPQSMRAVVSQVGIYDTLRWETEPNGEFNTTEFGSVKDPGAVQGALRLFAAAAGQGRRRLSGRAIHDRRATTAE